MKRVSGIFTVILVLLVMSGCAGSVKDIKLTSFDIVSLSPRGFTGVDALVELGVDNPAVSFELFDMSGFVKLDGVPCLRLTADQLVVQGKCSKIYSVPVKGQLADGFNPFSMLTLFQNADLSRITVDLSARVNIRGGLGKNIELKDLPLGKIVGGAGEFLKI